MKRISIDWRKAVFGVAVAGALGFGATQASARTVPVSDDAAAACSRICVPECPPEFGGSYIAGRCYCCG